MNKATIRNQIKLNLISKLTHLAEEVEYVRRIIEAINQRNYAGLSILSSEFGIFLGTFYGILENKAIEYLKADIMPRSCELSVLESMFSPEAGNHKLVSLADEHPLEEQAVVRELYFLVFGQRKGGVENGRVNELIEKWNLVRLRDFIWERGIAKFANERYRAVKEVLDKELELIEIIDRLGTAAVFDESSLIRRFVDTEMDKVTSTGQLKDDLGLERSFRDKAAAKVKLINEILRKSPCDYVQLKQEMKELHMDLEIARIEETGIGALKDYVQSKSVLGARDVALRYDFVCPAVEGIELSDARRIIKNSFVNQAVKTKKGRVFLRQEALLNIQFSVISGECFRFPNGYLLAIIRTDERAEHYLFGKYPSKTDQDTFINTCLGNFYHCENWRGAVQKISSYYMKTLGPDIRMTNVFKRIIFALPLVLGLAVMVGALYFLTLGGFWEATLVGGGIMVVGTAIAGKNGYDEEITPASHEKIPEYLSRRGGKLQLDPLGFELPSGNAGEDSGENKTS